MRLDADARGHRERADPVLDAAALGGDEVGKADVRAFHRLVHLLAQEVKQRRLPIHLDPHVVADALRRPQAEHRLRGQPPFRHDAFEHRQRVAMQGAGLRAHDRVGEDRGVLAGEFPGLEERRPVDAGDQFGERIVVEHVQAGLPRRGRHVRVPTAIEGLRARLLQRHQAPGIAAVAVALPDLGEVGVVGGDEGGAQVGRHQRLGHADRARGVLHPHRGRLVMRVDLERGMRARGRRPADHQGQGETLALHLAGDVAHLLQRRRDQPGQADEVGADFARGVQDLLRRHHHAKVDDLEVVAGQDHANDVLADVVDVALDRGHHDPAIRLADVAGPALFLLDVGQQVGDRLLHHPRRLHHLRQEHLPGAEQVADHVHAVHQRAFDHVQRARGQHPRFLGVGLDPRIQAVHQRVAQAFAHRQPAPAQVLGLLLALPALETVGDLQQALGAVAAAVEHHVLDAPAQVGVEVVVQRQRAGVDDAHVHAGADRVVQEHHVDRLPHRLVAAEAEADVRHAAGDMAGREAALELAGGLDEGHRVAIVLLDAGGDREHVWIEDDVLRREADFLGQQPEGARADLDLACDGVGLALFVEGHHHDGRAVAAHQPRLAQELGFAFLQRDRIDDALALQAFQPGLDHRPLRAVDHHRHAGDVGLGGDQVEEGDHRLLAVEQALVHVDVDHLRAVLDLLAGHRDGFVVAAFQDQFLELRATGDVGALADVDEVGLRGDQQRFQPGQAGMAGQRTHATSASAGTCRGGRPCTAAAIAAMCAGVVPQQPPTRFNRPLSANSRSTAAMSSGVSS